VALEGHLDQLVLDGTKIGWYPDRIEAWKRGERIAPITIDWALTRQCNYACVFCYAMLQENERKEQTREIAFNFLDDCAEIGVKGVSLISDGESTVHKDYVEVIEHGARVGLSMGSGTNGLLLRESVLERILPCLLYLRFNFSGGEPGRYSEIMGVKRDWFERVVNNIRDAMKIKRRDNLPVTINIQMVVMPNMHDQILPLTKLAITLMPDYLIFKHCADDVNHQLGVDYEKYDKCIPLLKEAEVLGKDNGLHVAVKWSRLDGVRTYSRCYGPPFIMQVSGSGLVAPCGFLFNDRYRKFHIGNIVDQRFRDIWASDRYWEVMRYLASDEFDPRKRCGPNCLQHATNTYLFDHMHRGLPLPEGDPPQHLGFL
jgi:MoaA/NifB/PqqE/SkfB family radical SAM enzyme